LHDFGLSDDHTLAVLQDSFNPACVPPWDVKGLKRAIRQARANGSPDPDFGSSYHDNVDITAIVNGHHASESSPKSSTGSSPGTDDDDAGAKAEPEPVASDQWDDPTEIDRPSLPVFPVAVLPESLRTWVIATAEDGVNHGTFTWPSCWIRPIGNQRCSGLRLPRCVRSRLR